MTAVHDTLFKSTFSEPRHADKMVHPGEAEVVLGQLAEATRDGSAQEDVVTLEYVILALAGKPVSPAELRAETLDARSTLLRVLVLRFGILPEKIVARVNGADLDELHAWVLRLLDAETLDELFTG